MCYRGCWTRSTHEFYPMDITSQLFANDINRNRAWRRKVNFLHRGRDCRHTSTLWKPEKDWKMLWNRSLKRSRSKQLGIEYPRVSSAKRRKQAQYEFWMIADWTAFLYVVVINGVVPLLSVSLQWAMALPLVLLEQANMPNIRSLSKISLGQIWFLWWNKSTNKTSKKNSLNHYNTKKWLFWTFRMNIPTWMKH